MGITKMVLAGAAVLAASLPASMAGAVSTLDGRPSQTLYISNDAPFVVFGVTPTQIDRPTGQLRLSFIATDRLEQVHVFPFVRSRAVGPAIMRKQVTCGPRDAGSWECVVPVGELLAELEGPQGELGLRIEAHGDLRARAEHSTVIITLPVRLSG